MLNLLKVSKIKFSTISTLGTILVLISATFPFINNFLEIPFPQINVIHVKAANNNLAAVLWSLAICLQSSIIILTKDMQPYFASYGFVLFSSLYSSSFYFLPLLGCTPNEDFWFFFWLIIIVVLLLGTMHAFKLYLRVQKLKEKTILNTLKLNNINNQKL